MRPDEAAQGFDDDIVRIVDESLNAAAVFT